jgi:hypothetical protein
MNYYIQGDKEKADQIRAAFEAKGCVMHTGIQCDLSDMVYFSLNGKVGCMKLRNLDLFKTHPDYKELELPVEPKFNDGDVLVTTNIRSCPFIYRKTGYNNDLAYYYAGIDGNGDFIEGCLKRTLYHFGPTSDVAPATKEQRDLLFQKMKEAGYKWDAKKKELRKIKPHYDISNFKPFGKVLVRNDDSCTWGMSFFGRYAGMFLCCSNACFTQCIPFDGNEHLLGTTDMCDERFINW